MRFIAFLIVCSLWAAQNDDALEEHAAAAAAALKAGNYAAAERENRAVLRLQPNMAEAEMNLGLSCFLQKKYGAAVQAFERGLHLKPDMVNARLFLGISYFNLNRPAEALPFLERYAKEMPDDLQGEYFLGLTYLDLKRNADAERVLRQARRIEPRNIDVLYHLAQTYVGEARESPARREELARAYSSLFAEIESIDPASFRIAQLRAAFYQSQSETAKAVAELETLLRHDPHTRGLHYTLGCLYLEAEKYPQAISQFQDELLLADPEPRTYLQLGHSLLAVNEPQQALVYLHKAITVNAASEGAAWVEMGRAYRQLGQAAQAEAAFEKGIQLGERKANVYYQLSLAARRAGDVSKAKEALATSQKLRDEEKHPLPGSRN